MQTTIEDAVSLNVHCRALNVSAAPTLTATGSPVPATVARYT
jgi:hypothetical protein